MILSIDNGKRWKAIERNLLVWISGISLTVEDSSWEIFYLYDTVARFRTEVKFSPRYNNRGELTPGWLAPKYGVKSLPKIKFYFQHPSFHFNRYVYDLDMKFWKQNSFFAFNIKNRIVIIQVQRR